MSCDRHRLLRFVPRACPPSALPRSRSGVLCVLFFFWFFGDWSGRAEGSRSEGCSGGRSLVTHTSHTIRARTSGGGSVCSSSFTVVRWTCRPVQIRSRWTPGRRVVHGPELLTECGVRRPSRNYLVVFNFFFSLVLLPDRPPDHPGSGFFLARRNLHSDCVCPESDLR